MSKKLSLGISCIFSILKPSIKICTIIGYRGNILRGVTIKQRQFFHNCNNSKPSKANIFKQKNLANFMALMQKI